jgi:hypothetical protein
MRALIAFGIAAAAGHASAQGPSRNYTDLAAMKMCDTEVRTSVLRSLETGDEYLQHNLMQASFFDGMHQMMLKEVIRERGGWPVSGQKMVDDLAACGAWIVVMHADNDMRWQCDVMAAMRRLVSQGRASAYEYAALYDRVQINMGKRQLYGTQFMASKNGLKAIPGVSTARMMAARARLGISGVDFEANARQFGAWYLH